MRYNLTAVFILASLAAAATTNPVRITLSIEKDTYYFTEPIQTTYTIQNLSTGTLLLPVGFVDFPHGNPPLEIFPARTQQRVASLRMFIREDWFSNIFQKSVILGPGEIFSLSLDLLSIYYPDHNVGGPRLDTADIYRMTFVYRNQVQEQGTTYTSLVGEHRSNTVVFRLRPAAGAQRAALVRDLDSKDRNTLRRALDALSMASDEAVLPHLYTYLERGPAPLRQVACDDLSYFKRNAAALSKLLNVARNDPDEGMRIFAAGSLAKIGNPAAIPTLVEMCRQDDTFPKAATVAAGILLHKFKDPDHLDEVERVMKRHISPPSPLWERGIDELRKKAAK